MAKNKTAVDEFDTPVAEAPALYIPAEGSQPSLNQLAIVLGIPAVRLQSAQVAYKPIEGKPYTAKEINWASVSGFISRRLDKTGYDSVEAVYEAALATEYTPKRSSRTGTGVNKILHGTTPVRKGEVTVGTLIENRKSKEQFTVIFVNDTIVVYDPLTVEEGGIAISNSIGNRMFNMNFDIVE